LRSISGSWHGYSITITQTDTYRGDAVREFCNFSFIDIISCLMAHNGIPFDQLGPPWHGDIVPALPPQIINALDAVYGITYDLFLHHMEDNLPDGWAKW
jgi:hypothetical protein